MFVNISAHTASQGEGPLRVRPPKGADSAGFDMRFSRRSRRRRFAGGSEFKKNLAGGTPAQLCSAGGSVGANEFCRLIRRRI